jgi:(heptosyl)LPS beta-1,4-glucosyltransferase
MQARRAELPLSGVVVAQDEGDRIERCVGSMRSFCREVLVVDSGSRDDTVARARSAGARVEYHAWLGFANQKNLAIDHATQPWVLLLDADEWLDERATTQLRRLFADGGVESADVWQLRRRTYFLGRPLRHGGWGREKVPRLFRQGIHYLPARVHERLDTMGLRVGDSGIRLEHDTARSEAEYQRKLAGYARLWAEQQRDAGREAGLETAATHAFSYWLQHYILRGGFLDGKSGWRYHRCHTAYVLAKYLILAGVLS